MVYGDKLYNKLSNPPKLQLNLQLDSLHQARRTGPASTSGQQHFVGTVWALNSKNPQTLDSEARKQIRLNLGVPYFGVLIMKILLFGVLY